ncbi:MAG: hypothetical protein AMXMBFR64_21970 [Myxococcales bacterium]
MNQVQDKIAGTRLPLRVNRSGKAAPIILGVVVLAAIAFAVWWFAFRKAGGDASKLVTNYIPKDVQVVGGFDVKGFYDSTIYKELGPEIEKKINGDKSFKEMSDKAGFDYKKVATIAFGASKLPMPMARGSEDGDPKFVAVVTGSWDSTKMMGFLKESAGEKGEEKDIEGVKTITDKRGKGTVGFPADGVLLAGTPEMFGTAVKLSKGTGESVDANADLKAIRKHVDEGATFWMAMAIPKEALEATPGAEMFGKASHVALSVDLGGGIELKSAIKMASAEEATKAQTQIKMGIGLGAGFAASVPDIGEDLKKIVESVKVEVAGDVLTMSASASADQVKKLIEAGKKQGMLAAIL